MFGDVYISPDSEIIVVGAAGLSADKKFQINKRPIMLIARDEHALNDYSAGKNILLFFVFGLGMISLGIFLFIAGA